MIKKQMEIKFEYLGEDRLFPEAKRWKVEAIHVGTTRNKRKFTLMETRIAARSLSFRQLNINHDSKNRLMPFPENATEGCHFNEARMCVDCIFHISDPTVNALIETNRINSVSIEQIPTLGEKCDEVSCEQHGVAFIGMALLEMSVPPGDKDASGIVRMESARDVKISDLIVSDAQRTCPECTDFEACHTCKHAVEQGDDCMSKHIKEIKEAHPDFDMDQVIAIALSKCNLSRSQDEAWWWYRHTTELYSKI